jgi:hypothetical protein
MVEIETLILRVALFLCVGYVFIQLRAFQKALHTNSRQEQIKALVCVLSVLLLISNAINGLHLDSFLAVFSLFISIFIYLKQDTQTQKFEQFQKDALEGLRKGSQAAFDVLVAMRNDDLRKLYQNSELASHFTNLDAEQRELEKKRANYWRYRWIFETHEHATLGIKGESEWCSITVKILKTTTNFRKEKLIKTDECFNFSYYICQVDSDWYCQEEAKKYLSEKDLDFYWDRTNPNSWKGREIACTFYNDKVLAYSSENQGTISLKSLYIAHSKSIEDIQGGKSMVQTVEVVTIDSNNSDHFNNRIVDHKVSTSQGDAA